MAAKGTKAKKTTQRKLTAILCADVVGYSRLMGDDEEATLETLTAYRKVFTSEIKKHRGRVVDAKGDALLAEFAAVSLRTHQGSRKSSNPNFVIHHVTQKCLIPGHTVLYRQANRSTEMTVVIVKMLI